MTTPTNPLNRCDNCGRFGWHTTDRCPTRNLADVPPATTHDDNDKTHDLPVPDGATADEWNTITAQPSDIVRSLTGTGRYC